LPQHLGLLIYIKLTIKTKKKFFNIFTNKSKLYYSRNIMNNETSNLITT
jgi:hypothetical protein